MYALLPEYGSLLLSIAIYRVIHILRVSEMVNNKEDYMPAFIVGTMIELPRAALVADEIAKYADFFSFGTNDLTQTSFGISRDDASRFLETYIEKMLSKMIHLFL